MAKHPHWGLALLRLTLGVVFAAHGYQAIFTRGLGALAAQFAGWGVPLPLLSAPLFATLQLAGGVLLMLGLGTRPLALVLALITLVESFYAQRYRTLFGAGGLELPLLLSGGALALAWGGAGALALGERSGQAGEGEAVLPEGSRPRSQVTRGKRR